MNPVTNKIYVANLTGITVIDGATNRITSIPGGGSAIAVNPVTNRIYVVNNPNVIVIDGATNHTKTISDPYGIAIAVGVEKSLRLASEIIMSECPLPFDLLLG